MLGWFTHATTGIRFEYSDYSHYDLADEVIVIRSQTDMAYLGDNHWESRDEYHQYGLSSLVGLLVHEARHGDGYFHNCGYSEAAGAFGDDQTMEEMGAWAVAALYYKWIAEHSDVDYMTPVGAPSELYREQAAQAAESIMANRICDNYENTQ